MKRILSAIRGTVFQSSPVPDSGQFRPPDEFTMTATGVDNSVIYAVDYVLRLKNVDPRAPFVLDPHFVIDFIRVKIFGYADTSGEAYTHLTQPYIDQVACGTPTEMKDFAQVGSSVENPYEVDFDFAVNPTTGLPWAEAEFNTLAFGHYDTASSPSASAAYLMGITMVEVEVWGSPESIRLGGYTSYDVGRFDTGGPEAEVPPENAAKI